jgi:hypothetical protein
VEVEQINLSLSCLLERGRMTCSISIAPTCVVSQCVTLGSVVCGEQYLRSFSNVINSSNTSILITIFNLTSIMFRSCHLPPFSSTPYCPTPGCSTPHCSAPQCSALHCSTPFLVTLLLITLPTKGGWVR